MQQALRAAARKLLLTYRARGMSTILCRGGWALRGIAGAGGGAQHRSVPSAASCRPLSLRNPIIQHQPYLLYRTLGVPQLTVVNVFRPSDSPAATAAPRSFEQLGLEAPLVTALHGMGITEPTDIQSISIPALMKQPANYFLASHTGSGKTLAYLLPLVHSLKQEEGVGFVPRPKRPRVLVLGPTRELTEQITGVAKTLCHSAKFRATCINAYKSVSQQARALSGPIDVVVATPTRFLQHIKEGNVAYRDIRWLVVDEADTVFGQGWGEEVAAILAPLRSKPDPAHVLLVSATMTKPVQKAIRELVPDAEELKTATLHRAVSGSSHQFLTLPPGANKLQLLAEALGADSRRAQKVLVFCNTVDSCRAVEHFAREEGLPCVCYHGEMPPVERQGSMATFAAASTSSGGLQPIMIATDLAARGLDFPGTVDHVINFDFPTSSVDYLHRTGRTARAGNKGKITSIVTKRDKVLAQRIEYALERDEPLDAISAEKEVLPPSQMATLRREKANVKVREAEAVLGAKGMAKLRAAAMRTRTGTATSGKLRLRGGSGAGEKAAGGSSSSSSSKPSLRGPVRGAARFALLEERLQRRNSERGKGRPPGRSGSKGRGPGGTKGGP